MRAVSARAYNNQRSSKTHQHGQPAPDADALAQQRPGKRHDDEWPGEEYSGGGRHRNVKQADDKTGKGEQLQQRADELQLDAARGEKPQAEPRHEQQHHPQQVND